MDKNEQIQELENSIKSKYRTDADTLPAPPKLADPDANKKALEARQRVLNPQAHLKDVIDDKGTTYEEYLDQMRYGIPPKSATKEAKAAVGHHAVSVEMVDGKEVIVVKAPVANTPTVTENFAPKPAPMPVVTKPEVKDDNNIT